SEEAAVRACEIYMDKQDYAQAIPILKTLEQGADFQENIIFAQSNIMKASYQQKNYPQTIAYAEKVLANAKVDDRIKSDAHIMIARAAMATGDQAKAKTAYAEVQKIATGALAAEALYYDAYFKINKAITKLQMLRLRTLLKTMLLIKSLVPRDLSLWLKTLLLWMTPSRLPIFCKVLLITLVNIQDRKSVV